MQRICSFVQTDYIPGFDSQIERGLEALGYKISSMVTFVNPDLTKPCKVTIGLEEWNIGSANQFGTSIGEYLQESINILRDLGLLSELENLL